MSKGFTKKGLYVGGKKYERALETFTGSGIFYYDNGDVYEGDFQDGKPHGKGTFTLENGETISGQFENGLFLSQFSQTKKQEQYYI